MLDIIQSWTHKRNLRKQLLSLLAEMEKNLEYYYVSDQRQFLVGGFSMGAWEQAQEIDIIKKNESIQIYSTVLLNFNKAYAEHKSYEQWYTSDTKNKNNENAKKLHALKNELDHQLKPLEAIIITAGQTLEQELLNLGFITN